MDYQFLSQTMLFSGESPEEIKEMLSCLGAVTRSYGKGEIIYHAGECVHSMGLVLSGNVQIESDDVWGNHSVLDDITPGFFFAETYASLSKEPLMVNVVSAAAKTEVLFLNIGRLLTTCTNSCTHHNRLIHNLFFISHGKICCFRAESSTPHQSQSAGGCSLICLHSLLPQTVLILQFRLTDSSSQTT